MNVEVKTPNTSPHIIIRTLYCMCCIAGSFGILLAPARHSALAMYTQIYKRFDPKGPRHVLAHSPCTWLPKNPSSRGTVPTCLVYVPPKWIPSKLIPPAPQPTADLDRITKPAGAYQNALVSGTLSRLLDIDLPVFVLFGKVGADLDISSV